MLARQKNIWLQDGVAMARVMCPFPVGLIIATHSHRVQDHIITVAGAAAASLWPQK